MACCPRSIPTGARCSARCARTTPWKTSVGCSTWCSAHCRMRPRSAPTKHWPAAWSCSEVKKGATRTGQTGKQRAPGGVPPANAQPLPVLPQFSHITRYWDSEHECFAARLMPGEYYVTQHTEVIATVLGSCVSACIRESRLGLGGMNHFMLPLDGSQGQSAWGAATSAATRYGN